MKIELDFKCLDSLINKLVAERADKESIINEYESRKTELQASVNTVLSETYGIISDGDEIIKEDGYCGCEISIPLKKLSEAELDKVDSLYIQFCTEHNGEDDDEDDAEELAEELKEYKEVLAEIAEEMWQKDANAKNDYKYRKLFKLAGV